jgi:uncharacterized membrane protein YidH (DUF202 family)
MELFVETMTNLGLFVLINGVYLLVSTPIVKAYALNNVMDTAKALTSIFGWMAVSLIVGLTSAYLLLA